MQHPPSRPIGSMAAIALGLTAILSSPAAQAQGQPVALGGVVTSTLAAGYDADQRLYLFGRGTDRLLYYRSRPAAGAAWDNWQPLGGGGILLGGKPALGLIQGRLTVFARGPFDAAYYRVRWNHPVQPFTQWLELGGVLTSDPVVAVNADGRPEVFVRGTDNALWHLLESGPGGSSGWYAWQSLGVPSGGPMVGAPAVGMNENGSLTVFVRNNLGVVLARTQIGAPSSRWSDWTIIGGIATSDPVVVRGEDKTLTVFFNTPSNRLAFQCQVTPNAIEPATPRSWKTGASIELPGGSMTGNPSVVLDRAGRVHVFLRDAGNRIHRAGSVQPWLISNLPTSPAYGVPLAPAWGPWSPIQFTASQDPVAFREATTNNPVLFAADAGGAVWELPASWLGIN